MHPVLLMGNKDDCMLELTRERGDFLPFVIRVERPKLAE
jgi:hypothetical protein